MNTAARYGCSQPASSTIPASSTSTSSDTFSVRSTNACTRISVLARTNSSPAATASATASASTTACQASAAATSTPSRSGVSIHSRFNAAIICCRSPRAPITAPALVPSFSRIRPVCACLPSNHPLQPGPKHLLFGAEHGVRASSSIEAARPHALTSLTLKPSDRSRLAPLIWDHD